MNSELLNPECVNELPYDSDSIDLSYEEFISELQEQGKTEDEIEAELDCFECDSRTFLVGNAWFKGADGKYEIDKTKEYAATYSGDSGNISIEWSKYTRKCNNTSPCYVMADGSGPCGDLDTPGDAVIAYDLPPEFYNERNES